jgi:hypothetical protein
MDDMFRVDENGMQAFICRCDEAGKAEADALLAEVRGKLGGTASDFLTRVIHSLHRDFSAHITGMHADQWFLITAEDEKVNVLVQCDEAEDGVAAVWKAFADRKNDEGTASAQTPEEQDQEHPET